MSGDSTASDAVLVVLGAKVYKNGVPSPAVVRRSLHAAELFKQNMAPAIIASGGLGRDRTSEAGVIQRLLVEQGVPESVILLEENSRSTLGNALQVKQLMAEKNFCRAIVITDGAHMLRSLMTFKAVGVAASSNACTADVKHGLSAPHLKFVFREVVALTAYIPVLLVYYIAVKIRAGWLRRNS